MSNAYDITKLFCVRTVPGGIQAACPICREEGKDRTGNHLKIFNNGSFHCIVGSEADPTHNKRIYQLLRNPNADTVQFIEDEPLKASHVEKTYPEDSLNKLLKNYEYWNRRGVKSEVLAKLENGVAPYEEKSKLSGRSIFPIRDPDSNLIMGFTGRLTEPNSFAPKWKHLFAARRAVYPWHINGPTIKQNKRVVLVESIGDLLGLMSYDINECLCVFGLNLNGRIISTLIAHDIKTVVVSLNRDNDPTKGQAAMEKIYQKLTNFWPEDKIVLRLPPEGFKDWGECAEAAHAQGFEAFREELSKL